MSPRNVNRVAALDANSCADCHNTAFSIAGGGGIVVKVFVLGQCFDFATFNGTSPTPTRVPL